MSDIDLQRYKDKVEQTRRQLQQYCDHWSGQLEAADLPESFGQQVQSFIGQSMLLKNSKLQQFSVFVDGVEHDRIGKKVLDDDLIGFWELIAMQITDLERMNGKLERMRSNGYVDEEREEVAPTTNGCKKKTRKAVAKPASASSSLKSFLDQQRKLQKNGNVQNGHGTSSNGDA